MLSTCEESTVWLGTLGYKTSSSGGRTGVAELSVAAALRSSFMSQLLQSYETLLGSWSTCEKVEPEHPHLLFPCRVPQQAQSFRTIPGLS